MRLTTRQNGIISYAGLEEAALWEGAKRAFVRSGEELPERFKAFLPLFPMELIVNMSYVGRKKTASPAGFSMSSDEYHSRLSAELPELYAGDNRLRCFRADGAFRGGVVTVDAAWAAAFPQYAPFQGEKLMIHMIGGGHQAVAVPESIFPRSGGILAGAERDLGITARCRQYCAWMRERLRLGDSYDPLRFEAEYLEQTELKSFVLHQKTLARVMQDLSIVSELSSARPQPARLYTEIGTSAGNIPQYAPYRCACDVFEPAPITRQTTRLVQLFYEGDTFQSDLWFSWHDASQYLNKKKNTLDVRALCDGFQIAPAADADTRGGVYPGRLRMVSVIDRSLCPMAAETINNPAYGSGMNPMGMINRIFYLENSAALLEKGQLLQESHSIVCENTRISEEELLRMRAAAEWQEHKGRLIDAMYRRESALEQMQPGTLAYERARDVLNAKVERLEQLIKAAPAAYIQRSGYDADIEYLRRRAQCREGLADAAFTPDPQRERSVECGFAMRSRPQSVALADLYQKPPKEEKPAKEPPRRQRAANGQWFEQMDFLGTLK